MVWHTNLMHVWLWLRLSFCVCYFSLNVYNLEKKKQNILWPMKSHGSPPCMFEALRSFESFDEMYDDPTQRIVLLSQSIMALIFKPKCSRYGKNSFHDFTHICFLVPEKSHREINIGGGSGDPCHLCTLENNGR